MVAGDHGLAARLGGDEFAIWLDDADAHEAEATALSLQRLARELAPYSADAARPIGYSIGIAVHRPHASETVETLDALVARADAAMYAVKHDGKDGIRVAPAVTNINGEGSND
jgi:diguanylate cyclase (GGDEF)-like protein